MKRLLLILMSVLMLSGCMSNNIKTEIDQKEVYGDYIEFINENQNFESKSDKFNLSYEIAKIDEGYRYYIFIDDAKIALYNIEALAMEEGVDYSRNMAPSLGIFEDKTYNIVPNQTKLDDGYVKGLMLSGVSQNPNPKIKMMVTYTDQNNQKKNTDFFAFEITMSEVRND